MLAGLRQIVGTGDEGDTQLLDISVYAPNYEWRLFLSKEYSDNIEQPRMNLRNGPRFYPMNMTPTRQQILEDSLVQVAAKSGDKLLEFRDDSTSAVSVGQKEAHVVPSMAGQGALG